MLFPIAFTFGAIEIMFQSDLNYFKLLMDKLRLNF